MNDWWKKAWMQKYQKLAIRSKKLSHCMKEGKRETKKVNQIRKLESHWMKAESLSAKGQYIGWKEENVKQERLSAKGL